MWNGRQVNRLSLMAIAFSIALLGAAPIDLMGPPAVVVYPLVPNDSTVDRELTSRLATTMAAKLGESNTIKVVAPVPGAQRSEFLADAQKAGADYYVSGYASGLGNGVSAVVQVVSVRAGIVIYSLSTQLEHLSEITGPAESIRGASLHYTNRNLTEYAAPNPTPAPSPTPSPSPSGSPKPTSSASPATTASAPRGWPFWHRVNPPSPSPSPTPSVSATATP
jgi:hypothetical protein